MPQNTCIDVTASLMSNNEARQASFPMRLMSGNIGSMLNLHVSSLRWLVTARSRRPTNCGKQSEHEWGFVSSVGCWRDSTVAARHHHCKQGKFRRHIGRGSSLSHHQHLVHLALPPALQVRDPTPPTRLDWYGMHARPRLFVHVRVGATLPASPPCCIISAQLVAMCLRLR
jgi:hypothetical protein